MGNPFGAGQGLSTLTTSQIVKNPRLNPFRAGRCLSTVLDKYGASVGVSIPLEQGGVFRLRGWFGALMGKA